MPLLDHLRELRGRIIKSLIFIGVGSIIAWFFYDPILEFLKEPYCSLPAERRAFVSSDSESCQLLFFGPLDGFLIRIKVSAVVGLVVSSPLWLYQVWAFVTPGLYRNERKWSSVFVTASSLLFAGGAFLAYFTLDKGLELLIGSAGSGTAAAIAVKEYLSFVISMLLIFGLSFELPLLVVMLNIIGVLPYSRLRRWQRLAIFLTFVFAAVVTPSQDPFTMCALALPMCVLFEAAVLFAWFHDRRKAQRIGNESFHDLSDDETSPLDVTPSRLN